MIDNFSNPMNRPNPYEQPSDDEEEEARITYEQDQERRADEAREED